MRVRIFILLALVLLLPLAARTQNALTYVTNNGAITITGHVGVNSSVTNVVIPASINGYPVVNVDVDAFYTCTKLTNVVVPASVTNLADKAFANCSTLTNLLFLGNAPVLGVNVFLSVPTTAVVSYLNGTSGWGASYGGLNTAVLNTTIIGISSNLQYKGVTALLLRTTSPTSCSSV